MWRSNSPRACLFATRRERLARRIRKRRQTISPRIARYEPAGRFRTTSEAGTWVALAGAMSRPDRQERSLRSVSGVRLRPELVESLPPAARAATVGEAMEPVAFTVKPEL